jgi:hypothetical protein
MWGTRGVGLGGGEQATARTKANPCGMTNKGTGNRNGKGKFGSWAVHVIIAMKRE